METILTASIASEYLSDTFTEYVSKRIFFFRSEGAHTPLNSQGFQCKNRIII